MEMDIEHVLREIARRMDITKEMRAKAITAYTSVGEYLQNQNQGECVVDIHPQGSFNLGTVVRPRYENEEYDIDLVCLVNDAHGYKLAKDAKWLKARIGKNLKEHGVYGKKLDAEGKRCWTLQYDEFHMDILPCRSFEDEYADPGHTRIELTNRNEDGSYKYLLSDPAAYRQWFEDRMKVVLYEARCEAFAMDSAYGEIERVPVYDVRTPLQMAIQLLKRHRDEFYANLPSVRQKRKPISMIITTLAAKAYNGERSLVEALKTILKNIADGIERDADGNPAVWNPVLGSGVENFAEKWKDDPEREREFNIWLYKARDDFAQMLSMQKLSSAARVARRSMGGRLVESICMDSGVKIEDDTPQNYPIAVFNQGGLPKLFQEWYRQKLPAHEKILGKVNIVGFYLRNGFEWRLPSNAAPLPKNRDLLFRIKSNVPGPYEAMWQVVNRGEEAERADGLRGGFDGGKSGVDNRGPWHKEVTAYRGTHYIVCYLMRGGVCIGKSPEFVVNIE